MGIVAIIEKKATGIYHLSGEDMLTPYEMAGIVAGYLDLNISLLQKVTADNFSQPAKRPLNTSLVIDKAKKELAYQPGCFEVGVKKIFS